MMSWRGNGLERLCAGRMVEPGLQDGAQSAGGTMWKKMIFAYVNFRKQVTVVKGWVGYKLV
ncbi:hypothetical protein Pint_34518 [Pistacia integerrima]|uniref:Uncharacterized protein n=1 Tax=Pistacia integerrima TaxID=434235 RepID=A0ACC0X5A9_9ROSI|nr:hypothetical protein Pint_34518 [Pistacia integerrima]